MKSPSLMYLLPTAAGIWIGVSVNKISDPQGALTSTTKRLTAGLPVRGV